MGDLKQLRHAIIHARNVLSVEKHRVLKKLRAMFSAGQPITISYDDMHTIFVLVKQDCARLLLEWLNVSNAEQIAADLKDVAIQRSGQP